MKYRSTSLQLRVVSSVVFLESGVYIRHWLVDLFFSHITTVSSLADITETAGLSGADVGKRPRPEVHGVRAT